jgi:hypothetical protein
LEFGEAGPGAVVETGDGDADVADGGGGEGEFLGGFGVGAGALVIEGDPGFSVGGAFDDEFVGGGVVFPGDFATTEGLGFFEVDFPPGAGGVGVGAPAGAGVAVDGVFGRVGFFGSGGGGGLFEGEVGQISGEGGGGEHSGGEKGDGEEAICLWHGVLLLNKYAGGYERVLHRNMERGARGEGLEKAKGFEEAVFRFVVEVRGIDGGRRSGSLPGDGAAKGFVLRDDFGVAEVFADGVVVDDEVMAEVDFVVAEMRGALVLRNDEDLAAVIGGAGEFAEALGGGGRWGVGGFADVIDFVGGGLGGDGEGERMGDIFDVRVGPFEVALRGAEEDRGALVVDAFEGGKEAVAGIVWSVGGRHAKNGDGEAVRVGEEGLFHINFFVGVIAEIARGAERRVFGEAEAGGGKGFLFEERAEGGVDVLRGGDDDSGCVVGKGLDSAFSVLSGHGEHVEDGIKFLGSEGRGVGEEVGEVAMYFGGVRGEIDVVLATVIEGEGVVLCGEHAQDMGAGEGGSTEDEDVHFREGNAGITGLQGWAADVVHSWTTRLESL